RGRHGGRRRSLGGHRRRNRPTGPTQSPRGAGEDDRGAARRPGAPATARRRGPGADRAALQPGPDGRAVRECLRRGSRGGAAMRAELVFTTGVGVLAAVGLAMAVGFGLIAGHIAVLFVLSCAIAYLIGRRVALPEERRWLPALLLWAMVAKLIGASFRYWLLFSIYG